MKPVIEADRANGARISEDIAGGRVEAGAREARGALDDGDEERDRCQARLGLRRAVALRTVCHPSAARGP